MFIIGDRVMLLDIDPSWKNYAKAGDTGKIYKTDLNASEGSFSKVYMDHGCIVAVYDFNIVRI